MFARTGLSLAAAALLLSGCAAAPQRSIELNSAALSPSMKIGVVMSTLPAVDTSLPGAGCLLCAAAASIANASLTSHAKTLPHEGIGELDKKMVEVLAQRGLNVKLIARTDFSQLPSDRTPDHAPVTFKDLGASNGVDKLVVIDLKGIGFLRPYANYFPTSDPKAWVGGAGYIVDVKTNALDWYLSIDIQKASNGPWDEAPKFPGLTNAYFQAIELTLDSYLNPFRHSALAAEPAPAAAEATAPATEAASEPVAVPVSAPATPAPVASPADAAGASN